MNVRTAQSAVAMAIMRFSDAVADRPADELHRALPDRIGGNDDPGRRRAAPHVADAG